MRARYRATPRHLGTRRARSTIDDVAIIVPVYGDANATRDCLTSVVGTTPETVSIVIVNDASPDPAMAELIRAVGVFPRITVIENEKNLGFPASVNKGLAVFPNKNAVILNADTMVFANWLDRLLAHSADQSIATITPLTNAGSIASYPGPEEAACTRDEAEHLDALAQGANRGVTVDVPTGVGFCMFIRRHMLDQVGPLDEALFGIGYGEENDLCMRASASGWRHVVACDVFVLHANGASFGHRKSALLSRSAHVMAQRHPTYPALVAEWQAADPLMEARRNLDLARLAARKTAKVLLLSHAGAGGVPRHVDERAKALIKLGYDPMVLRPLPGGKIAVTLPEEKFPSLVFDVGTDLGLFRSMIDQLDPAHVEIHHILGTDPRFVEVLLDAGKPVDFVLHDFSMYCGRINLIDDSNRYCGEGGPQFCRECHARLGSIHSDKINPAALKARSERWFAKARRITVPSADTQRRYAAQFPDVAFAVGEWEQLGPIQQTPRPLVADAPRKVALLGAIGLHKGYRTLLDCARHAALNDLPLEFVVIGYTQDDVGGNLSRQPLGESGLVHVTGEYDEAELAHLIAREKPDVFLFLSTFPETWCYTLTAAMRTGLPIVAVDLGAIGERLRTGYPQATLIAPDANASEINNVLLGRGGVSLIPAPAPAPAPAPVPPPEEIVEKIQRTEPAASQSRQDMASVNTPGPITTPRARDMATANTSIDATAEILNLARGLYLFTVPRNGDQQSSGKLPALQVTPAPGTTEKDYQILSATAADSQWITTEGDSIVLQVKSAVATVVMIVLNRAGRPALKIEVSKLDGEQLISKPVQTPINLQPQTRAAAPVAAPVRKAPPAIVAAEDTETLRCQIVAHVELQGDTIGFDRNWIGAGDGASRVEAFSITPMLNIAPHAIEYMALTGAGMQTPWLGKGRACGTRGLATPLIGFAVRARPGPSATRFTCAYHGRFASGAVVGPVRDGALCRSPQDSDPLVDLWVEVMDGEAAGNSARAVGSADGSAEATPGVAVGRKRKSSIFSD